MAVALPPRSWGPLNRCTTNSRLALVWFSMRKGLWMVSTCGTCTLSCRQCAAHAAAPAQSARGDR